MTHRLTARGGVRSPDVLFVRGGAREPARRRAATTDLVARTRRQTADVAQMLRALAPRTTAYLALLEDDWLLCEGGLRALLYLEAKASLYRPDWAALRFSYGLNGILLRSADAPALAAFLEDPAAERENKEPDAPVDHLAYRFLRGKYAGARAYFGARRIVAFRHTLFWHIGGVSAVQGSATSAERHRPPCFARTGEWLFDSERFHADECPDDDVWPCAPRPPLQLLARARAAGCARSPATPSPTAPAARASAGRRGSAGSGRRARAGVRGRRRWSLRRSISGVYVRRVERRAVLGSGSEAGVTADLAPQLASSGLGFGSRATSTL